MLIVSQCLQCGRGYTAPVIRCQICGGNCVPVEPGEASAGSASVEVASAGATLSPACPCCGETAGPYAITQETRHLKGVSWFPAKRTYLVTRVKIPGVCALCHRTIEWKRVLAGALTPLPLFVFFGILVVADRAVFLVPVLLYLIYLARQLTYTWADFLLFGRALSWQLVDHVPAEDRDSAQRYPGGMGQLFFRIGFYPVVLAIFVGLVQMGVIVKPRFKADPPAIANAETPPPSAPAVSPRPVSEPVAPAVIARAKTPVEEALRIFRMTARFAVPVDAATVANPQLGHPATTPWPFRKKLFQVVQIYSDEMKLPPGTAYVLMNGPAALAAFATVKSDGLLLGGGPTFLTPAEVAELATQLTGAVAPPSPLKWSTEH